MWQVLLFDYINQYFSVKCIVGPDRLDSFLINKEIICLTRVSLIQHYKKSISYCFISLRKFLCLIEHCRCAARSLWISNYPKVLSGGRGGFARRRF